MRGPLWCANIIKKPIKHLKTAWNFSLLAFLLLFLFFFFGNWKRTQRCTAKDPTSRLINATANNARQFNILNIPLTAAPHHCAPRWTEPNGSTKCQQSANNHILFAVNVTATNIYFKSPTTLPLLKEVASQATWLPASLPLSHSVFALLLLDWSAFI